MIHIILAILKVVGILILIILGILLFLILTLLFVPFGYRIKGSKDADILAGSAAVSWLAGLVLVRVRYLDKEIDLKIWLFGIELKHLKKLLKLISTFLQLLKKLAHPIIVMVRRLTPSRYATKENNEVNEKLIPDPNQETTQAGLEKKEHKDTEQPIQTNSSDEQKKAGFWDMLKMLVSTILAIPRRIFEFVKKIYLTILKIYGRIKQWKLFLTAKTTKRALKFLLGEGKELLYHIRPRKVKGNLKFGFEDPAATGQILAGLSVIYPFYKNRLIITPVFNEKILEGDLYLRGHILGWVLLKIAWKIYRNTDVKTTIRKFQHKEA